jgi:hypothetical protein
MDTPPNNIRVTNITKNTSKQDLITLPPPSEYLLQKSNITDQQQPSTHTDSKKRKPQQQVGFEVLSTSGIQLLGELSRMQFASLIKKLSNKEK